MWAHNVWIMQLGIRCNQVYMGCNCKPAGMLYHMQEDTYDLPILLSLCNMPVS